MPATIHKLEVVEVGEGFRFESDTILEQAKGRGLANVVVIGECEDGTTWVSSAGNAGVALVLMERAKKQIVFGD